MSRYGMRRRKALAVAVAGGLTSLGLPRSGRAASGVRILASPEQLRPVYDYIIVGAGSAGCVLAYRLGRAGRRVLIIEAGGPANLPAVESPPQWPTLQGGPLDWGYTTTPQPGLAGRVVRCPRGKAVGGSSAINALAYQRGHPAAYNKWPQGWRHADLLPYFKRAETFSGGASAWHGGSGPLHVLSLADVSDRTPIASAFISAAQEYGFRMTADISGEVTTGVGWNQLSVKGHTRDYAANAYLDTLQDAQVDLLHGAEVRGLAIERDRCVGVRLAGRVVQPDGEVLLCAGAVDSPRLLMVSGIGPADELRSHGITITVDLPDVGRHLQDHILLAGVAYRARREVPRSHYNHADSLLYVPHGNPGESPSHLVMCLSLPFVLPTVGPLPPPAYVLTPCLLRPQSEGTVKLRSPKPLDSAVIDPNYLTESTDLESLSESVSLTREIGAAAAFAEWRVEEVYPGSGWPNAADRHGFIRRAANSFHHPVGTCRMGDVVDEALRVKGVRNLRIIDASVLPGLPAAMVNAAVTAVAEKASDRVLAG